MNEKNLNKIVVNNQPSGGKPWGAKIVGKDAKYGFKREFLRYTLANMSSSGKTGNAVFYLQEDGFYEIRGSWSKGRDYYAVENGIMRETKLDEIMQKVN